MSRAPRPERRYSDDAPAEADISLPRYTVRAVAERLGVPTATLRSWNQRYGVGPSGHTPGRHRLYSEADIAMLQEMGDLVRRGVNPRSAAAAAMHATSPNRADAASLLSAAFELDVDEMGRQLDNHFRHYGVVDTWNQLIRPAFVTIEAQQGAGVGCIDVEHALSWTVARSLQRVPSGHHAGVNQETAPVILACTENEAHTLPLEALRAALSERHRTSLMLGAAVPQSALLDALARHTNRSTVALWAQSPDTADVAAIEALTQAHASVVVVGPGWEAAALPRSVPYETTFIDAVARLAGSG
ncbi:MerR family transcriptional regulator [Mycobacterium deserti]|uniref:MerR family transcriptional regulator n=1 Tax=Mycobacterium deserti TaxID=2978347 RepID=A0ABT2MEY1_9MYCO|nr:MerR family transcriptional regulator [Mycobacterium deserti]MCT7660846.1 MerR family transcriptional regulator [Mycobacterium deserti]